MHILNSRTLLLVTLADISKTKNNGQISAHISFPECCSCYSLHSVVSTVLYLRDWLQRACKCCYLCLCFSWRLFVSLSVCVL